MASDLHYLAYSAVLTWVMLLSSSLIHAKGWTPKGLVLAVGSRDLMPERSVLAGRADRAAKNMLENLVLFAVCVLVARLANVPAEKIAPGASLFFWARVVYWVVYLVGVPWLRTVVWAASVTGLVMILMAGHVAQ